MITFTRAACRALEDGKIALLCVTEDGLHQAAALTPIAASEAIFALLQAGAELPKQDQTTARGVMLEGTVSLGIRTDMSPAILLSLGGIEIAVPITHPQQLLDLQQQIATYFAKPVTSSAH